MATVATREAYFETGLEVLADLGFGGLKLAEVCNRLGVTTGSFYHYFVSWPAYTRELISYWVQDRTIQLAQAFSVVTDPRERMQVIIRAVLALPHGAEAAIRSWSSVDPEVYKVQVEVDKERFRGLLRLRDGHRRRRTAGRGVRRLVRIHARRLRAGDPAPGSAGLRVDQQPDARRTRLRQLRHHPAAVNRR